MANIAKETLEPVKLDDAKSSGTGVGPSRAPARRGKPAMKILLVVLALAIIAISIPLYRYYTAWESTDDAQIDGYVYPVSSRVSGYVTRVTVDDNQYVEAGTVLAQLDPKDYEVAVANAKATLANDQASAAAMLTNVPITSVNTSSSLSAAQADVENAKAGVAAAQRQFDAAQASLRQAEANDLKAQDDVNRYKPLAAKDEIPQQRYAQAVDSQKATAAAVEAARASAAAAEQAVTQAHARVSQAQAQLQYAETVAMLREAGRKLREDPRPLLRLAQQQAPRVAGDRSPVKPPAHLAPTQGMKLEGFLVTLCSQKAVLLLRQKSFSQKYLCQKETAFFNLLVRNAG